MDPPDSRILAITEMPTPKTKKELQSLMGMISSLKSWFPNIKWSIKSLSDGTAHNAKFTWKHKMEEEFKKVKMIFTKQI